MPQLPGAPAGEDDRVVCHVDVDCFYAACERLREPDLRGEPVVVGMGFEPGETHGAVATASYEAREYGVESAQAISEALERLGRKAEGSEVEATAYYRPVDMEYYEEVAEDVRNVLHEEADVVRAVSIDEAYLDVTDRVDWTDREGAEAFGRELKARIDAAVGVTASVGIAANMSTAKVASDRDKPDGLVVVEPGAVRSFLSPLDVRDLHGVGPVTASELRDTGIETAGDLADADPDAIEERFGERGRELYDRARGRDDRVVEPVGKPKSLSRESAFADATADTDEKRDRVRALATDVAERARGKDALYKTIGIKVVTPPYDVNTRAHSLPGPVDDPELVEDVALDLLEEFDGESARKLGVRVANLSFTQGDQSSLDSWNGNGEARSGEARSGEARSGEARSGEAISTEGTSTEGTSTDGDGDGPGVRDSDWLPPGQTTLGDFL